MLNQQPSLMGVLNVTPNSFSDGGQHAEGLALEQQALLLVKQGVRVLDVGAESTAPMNQPITFDEEWRRLEPALSLLQGLQLDVEISIDTYRPETMERVLSRFPGFKRVWWNDVSGVVDGKTVALLKRHPSCGYVLCHNRAPFKDAGARHMQYASKAPVKGGVVDEVEGFFRAILERHPELWQRPLFLDPCLGFAKSHEENWALIHGLPELAERFSGADFLLGISRKSFLRKASPDGARALEFAQLQEALVYRQWRALGFTPLLRVHDPLAAIAAYCLGESTSSKK